jgi:hypothetical protein
LTKVENRKLAELSPFDKNARTHSPEQIEQLVASIRQFGFTNPVLVTPDGTVVAGHGRLEAAKAAGLEEVPTLTVGKDWTPEQLRAYVLADNQLALNAGWDEELLKLELADLKDFGFDISLVGFDVPTLDSLFGEQGGEGAGANDGAPAAAGGPEEGRRTLMERFGLAPFSVLSARGGWWQDRKRAWLSLGIESELGRGENLGGFEGAIDRREAIKANACPGGSPEPLARARAGLKSPMKANATPGGSMMPAADYSKTKARGDGAGRAVEGTDRKGRKANVNPGGGGAKGAYIRGGRRADPKYQKASR